MTHHIIVTDRNRGDLMGEHPGGTHSVTVDDAATRTVGLGSAHQGFSRSGHTSVGRTVFVGKAVSGSTGVQAEGIIALPGRIAKKCGCYFPHSSGSHGQAAGRPQGTDGSGSGAVAVGNCSTGNVTTAMWGAKSLGRRGNCFPAPEPVSKTHNSATLYSLPLPVGGYAMCISFWGLLGFDMQGRFFS